MNVGKEQGFSAAFLADAHTHLDQYEPAHVRLVAHKLAEVKGVSLEEVARATTGNLLRMLRLQAPG